MALIDLASGEMRTLEGAWTEAKRPADELFKAAPKEIVFPKARRTPCGAFSRPTGRTAPSGARSKAGSSIRPRRPASSSPISGPNRSPGSVSRTGPGPWPRPGPSRLRQEGPQGFPGPRPPALLSPRRRPSGPRRVDRPESRARPQPPRRQAQRLAPRRHRLHRDAPGGRLLRAWLLRPLLDVAAIAARLDAVGEWLGATIARREFRESLKGVLDLERLAGKISLAAAHPRDLVALKRSLAPAARRSARGPRLLVRVSSRTWPAAGTTRRHRRPHRPGDPR